MPKYWALGAALAVSIGVPLATTSAVELPDEYSLLIQQHSRIGMLDGGFFGDHVGLSTGSLEIVQTDVDLSGNNALPVRVGRRFQPGSVPVRGHFSDWDLDIPHLHGVFGGTSNSIAWLSGDADGYRCSQFSAPPVITIPVSGGEFNPDEYWFGTSLYIPGSGEQELLWGGDVPSAGGPYPASTREGAIARCLPTLASTSDPGSIGEGFEIITPDGVVYTFDQMVWRDVYDLTKTDPVAAPAARTAQRNGASASPLPSGTQGADTSTNAPTCCTLQRREYFLYPTKVSDRFGNFVTYTWDAGNPWRLLHITASDGRNLDLAYSSSDASSRSVQSVTATGPQPRTWNYAYASSGDLAGVTQPDGKAWQFSLSDLRTARAVPTGPTCDTLYSGTSPPSLGTITAPSGATVEYQVTKTIFGRSWVRRDCKDATDQSNEYVTEPYLFVGLAITRKKVIGPGLPGTGLIWTYSYGTPNDCWDPYDVPTGDPDAVICTASSPVWRTTTVTAPDETISSYSFGNRATGAPAEINEGLLQVREERAANGSVLRTTTFEYGDGDALPYSSRQGHSLRRRGDWRITGERRPQRSVTTTQQGATFTWNVPMTCGGNYCFDARARPTNVSRAGINTPAGSQAESVAYDDDETHWVLGQLASRTVGGVLAAQTIFDSGHLPWKVYAFGKLVNTYTYDTTSAVGTGQRGTLKTVKDGNDNVTTYASWKRGIPQSVAFADGTSRSAVVDDRGWITSVTDENGFATAYAYDAMGRITQVTYPTSDDVAWNASASTFVPVGSAEQGVAAGHWRETVHTGNGYKVTLFDALWRPVLVHEYDSGAAGTDRWMATAYDKAGRVADVSYPMATAPTMLSDATWQSGTARPKGVRTSYDALGRPTSVKQDSELGVLETKTDYLAGFKRRVTDARNNATTEQFMAWDSPTFDLPIQIDAPEGQRTTIARDVFGKPTSITRGATP